MPVKRRSATAERGRSRDDEDRYYRDEDEEDDRPRSRRRSDDDGDRDDDRRDRGTRRRRDDDEEDEDERPARRSSRRDDDEDEDERPRGRSRRLDRDDDEDDDRPRRRAAPRRGRDEDEDRDDDRRDRGRSRRGRDDDEDDRPARRGAAGASAINRGWAGAKKTRDQSGSFAPTLTLEKDETVVLRFLEDEPYASYRQHWVDRSGKRSYVCPEDPEDPKSPRCPLCDVGADLRAKYCFNVVLLDADEKPRIMSWEVGVRLLQQLEKINKDDRIGPLSEPYFSVTRTGKGTSSNTQITPVKERDLYDDYGIEPLTEGEFNGLFKKRYDASIVTVPGLATLREVANELSKYDG